MFYLTGVDDDDFNFVKEPRCPIHPLPFFFISSCFLSHISFLLLDFFFFFLPFVPQRLSMNDCFLFCLWAS